MDYHRTQTYISMKLKMTSLKLSLVLSLVFIVLGVFLFKYDWEKLIGRFQRKPQPGV